MTEETNLQPKEKIGLRVTVSFIAIAVLCLWTLFSLFFPICSVGMSYNASGITVSAKISDTGFSLATFSSLIIGTEEYVWAVQLLGVLSVLYIVAISAGLVLTVLMFVNALINGVKSKEATVKNLNIIAYIMLGITALYLISGIVYLIIITISGSDTVISTLVWVPLLVAALIFLSYKILPKILPETMSAKAQQKMPLIDENALEKLKKLKDLKDGKVITAEEFESKKEELLNRV